MKVSIRKSKLMVNGVNSKDGFSQSKVYSCGICGLSVKASSVLCVQCDK